MKLPHFILATLLVGCTADLPELDSAYGVRKYSNTKPTRLDATVAVSNRERGGAAFREAEYLHTLGHQKSVDFVKSGAAEGNQNFDVTKPIESAARLSRSSSDEPKVQTSYSIYEMSRWERYCGHGKMDEKDWKFVKHEGKESLPEILVVGCNPPSYSFDEYVAAWKKQCQAPNYLTTQETMIVNSTVGPENVCTI